MYNITVILKDKTEIELNSGSSLNSMYAIFTDWNSAANTLSKLTNENISELTIKNIDGVITGNYTDLVLLPGSWDVKDDGVHITISMRQKTDMEKRLETLEAGQLELQASQKIQDDTIMNIENKL